MFLKSLTKFKNKFVFYNLKALSINYVTQKSEFFNHILLLSKRILWIYSYSLFILGLRYLWTMSWRCFYQCCNLHFHLQRQLIKFRDKRDLTQIYVYNSMFCPRLLPLVTIEIVPCCFSQYLKYFKEAPPNSKNCV